MNNERLEYAHDIITYYLVERNKKSLERLKEENPQKYEEVKENTIIDPKKMESQLVKRREGKDGETVNSFLVMDGLNRDNLEDLKIIEELEEAGFKLLYPEEFKSAYLQRFDEKERGFYEINQKKPLVVDTREENCSLELADNIIKRVLHGYVKGSYSEEDNRKTYEDVDEEIFEDGVMDRLVEILNDVGFKDVEVEKVDSIDGPKNILKVSSSIPYQSVNKSKFGQIYEESKGKIIDRIRESLKNRIATKGETR